MVFYDKGGFALTKSQFASICKDMQVVDENTFLFSITEGSDPSYKMILENCGFPIGDDLYKEYLGLINYALENALFSTKGTWACLISHEDHAIIGGNQGFIQAIKENYASWREDYRDLIEFWKNNPNGGWIEELESRWISG